MAGQTVVPTLVEGLTEVALKRPADPLMWLSNFILSMSPSGSNYKIVSVKCVDIACAGWLRVPPRVGGADTGRALRFGDALGAVTNRATGAACRDEAAAEMREKKAEKKEVEEPAAPAAVAPTKAAASSGGMLVCVRLRY